MRRLFLLAAVLGAGACQKPVAVARGEELPVEIHLKQFALGGFLFDIEENKLLNPATLWVLPLEELGLTVEQWEALNEPKRFAKVRERGVIYATDEYGVSTIALGSAPTAIAGESGYLRGTRVLELDQLKGETKRASFQLFFQAMLRLQVLDRQKQPLPKVRVDLTFPGPPDPAVMSLNNVMIPNVTDERGFATIRATAGITVVPRPPETALVLRVTHPDGSYWDHPLVLGDLVEQAREAPLHFVDFTLEQP